MRITVGACLAAARSGPYLQHLHEDGGVIRA